MEKNSLTFKKKWTPLEVNIKIPCKKEEPGQRFEGPTYKIGKQDKSSSKKKQGIMKVISAQVKQSTQDDNIIGIVLIILKS